MGWFRCLAQQQAMSSENGLAKGQEILRRLEQIAGGGQTMGEDSLREYVDLYVRHHGSSEDFFAILCEHSLLQRLLSGKTRTLAALECLHLLLANTSKENELVYCLSQPTLHHFLFQVFDYRKEEPEALEYYVQLLKAILIKMGDKQPALLQLFCNSRFPSFPLLSSCACIATLPACDELVRVTAQQGVLLLANLCDRLATATAYFHELQMLVFYVELVNSMAEELEKGSDELLGYLCDLLLALRNNATAVSLIMNVVTNRLIVQQLETGRAVEWVCLFKTKVNDWPEEGKLFGRQIVLVLFRILTHYLTRKFVNFTYNCAVLSLRHINLPLQPDLRDFHAQRCSKISDYLLSTPPQGDQQLEFVFEQWRHCSERNHDWSPHKPQRRNVFSDFFTTKSEANEQYLKEVMIMGGLNWLKIKQPLFKLSVVADYRTSLFLVEQAFLNCQPDSTHYQFFQNEVMAKQWEENRVGRLLVEIERISRNMEMRVEWRQKEPTRGLDGEQYFLINSRLTIAQYLFSRLSDNFSRPTIVQINLAHTLLTRLGLRQFLDPDSISGLMDILEQMQRQLGQEVFDENKINIISRYIVRSREKTYLKEGAADKMEDKKQGLKSKLQGKLLQYEVIKRLLDNSLKLLGQHYKEMWEMNFPNQPLMAFRQKRGAIIEVLPIQRYNFSIKVSRQSESLYSFTLTDQDPRILNNEPNKLIFLQCPEGLELETQQKADKFIKDIIKLRQHAKQVLRSAVLQYLFLSYESLSQQFNHTQQTTPQ